MGRTGGHRRIAEKVGRRHQPPLAYRQALDRPELRAGHVVVGLEAALGAVAAAEGERRERRGDGPAVVRDEVLEDDRDVACAMTARASAVRRRCRLSLTSRPIATATATWSAKICAVRVSPGLQMP